MSNAAVNREAGRMRKRSVADVLIYGKSMVPALSLLLVILVLFFSFFTKNFTRKKEIQTLTI